MLRLLVFDLFLFLQVCKLLEGKSMFCFVLFFIPSFTSAEPGTVVFVIEINQQMLLSYQSVITRVVSVCVLGTGW